MSDFDEFFEGGGNGEYAPSLKFKTGSGPGGSTEVGGGVIGTIVSMQKQDQTKMGSTEKIPDPKKPGQFKQQIQLILQTELRNWDKVAKVPTVGGDGPDKDNLLPASEDDGKRAIYVKGWMTGAISDAVYKATDGRSKVPQVGGRLGVKVTELVPTDNGNPYPKYAAVYTPPASNVEDAFASAPTATVAQEQQQAAAVTPQGQQQAAAQAAPVSDAPPF